MLQIKFLDWPVGVVVADNKEPPTLSFRAESAAEMWLRVRFFYGGEVEESPALEMTPLVGIDENKNHLLCHSE